MGVPVAVLAKYSFRAKFGGSEASMAAAQCTRSAVPIRRPGPPKPTTPSARRASPSPRRVRAVSDGKFCYIVSLGSAHRRDL